MGDGGFRKQEFQEKDDFLMEKAMREEDLERMSEFIRGVYCKERNDWEWRVNRRKTDWGREKIARYDGGTDEFGREFSSVWPKIIKFSFQNKVNPVRLIKVCFSVSLRNPPDPFHICTQKSLGVLKEYEQQESTESIQLLNFQKEQYLMEVMKLQLSKKRGLLDDKAIRKIVLTCKMSQLSALFRYCVAKEKGEEEIAKMFFGSALLQYFGNSECYDRVWGNMIPNELKEEVKKLETYFSLHRPEKEVVSEKPTSNFRVIMID